MVISLFVSPAYLGSAIGFAIVTSVSAVPGGQFDGENCVVPLLDFRRSPDTTRHPYTTGIQCGQLSSYFPERKGESSTVIGGILGVRMTQISTQRMFLLSTFLL